MFATSGLLKAVEDQLIRISKRMMLGLGVILLSGPTALPQPQFSETYHEKAISLTAEAEELSSQWTAASFQLALKKYVAARDIVRVIGDREEEAHVLARMGKVFLITSKYREALTSFSESRRIYHELKNRKREAEVLLDIGEVYLGLGSHLQAVASSEEAMRLAGSSDPRVRALALTIIADATHFLSDIPRSSDSVEQALALWRSLKDYSGEARTLGRRAALLGDQGQMKEALELRDRALTLWRLTKNPQGEANTLTNIGSQLTFIGEYQRSLENHYRALAIFQTIGDIKGEANALANIGYTYFNLADSDQALFHYERASTLFRQISNRYYEATIIATIGDVYNSTGNNHVALKKYQQSLSMIRPFSDKQWEALILNSLGAAYLGDGRYAEAVDSYNEAVPLFHKLRNQRWEANTLVGLGLVYLKLDHAAKARDCFQQALSLSRAASDMSGESLAHFHLARVASGSGDLAKARSETEAALQINETLRSKVISPQARASYLASVHKCYELYIDVLMRLHSQHPEQGLDAQALEMSERGRARTLVEMLVETHSDIRNGVDPALLAREQGLETQLALEMQKQVKSGKTEKSMKEQARRERANLTGEYQSVEARIRAATQGYAALRLPPPLKMSEIQQLLDPNTLLLEYALGDDRSFLWAVTPKNVVAFELPGRAHIEDAARRTYARLTARNDVITNETPVQWERRIKQADKEYLDEASKLSEMLLAPLGRSFEGKRLVIISDGALQYIPFAALPVPGNRVVRGQVIGEAASSWNPIGANSEIVTLPSAAVLAVQRLELANRTMAAETVAVFADPVFDLNDPRVPVTTRRVAIASKPTSVTRSKYQRSQPARSASREKPLRDEAEMLRQALRDVGLNSRGGIPRLPFSRQEAEAILNASGSGQSAKLIDFRASRATLIAMDLSRFRILHFATHGFFDSEHPELSGIVLSLVDEKGQRQNGFVQLHEIYRLNLRAELVVLSACQSALGKDIRGEGMIGLTRGFMYAGAARVVASLWKVDDAATAALMAEFYKEMFTNGKRPAAALRAAQIRISEQKRWRLPYYWAGFVLQGEWR